MFCQKNFIVNLLVIRYCLSKHFLHLTSLLIAVFLYYLLTNIVYHYCDAEYNMLSIRVWEIRHILCYQHITLFYCMEYINNIAE